MDSRDTRYAGSRYLVFIINENKRDTLYASSDNWDTARECARGLADEIGDLEECVAQGRTDISNYWLDAWDACTYEEGDLEECNAQGKSYIPKESVYILDTKKLCIWIIQSVQRAKWSASQPIYDRSIYDSSESSMIIGEDWENLPGYIPKHIEEVFPEDSNFIQVYMDTRVNTR